eukprot:15464757-Alexandrium_andersonii.AAC.1
MRVGVPHPVGGGRHVAMRWARALLRPPCRLGSAWLCLLANVFGLPPLGTAVLAWTGFALRAGLSSRPSRCQFRQRTW